MPETEKTAPEKPGYWAVIPANVRYDEVIPPNAKLLYAEISALIGDDGFCFAKNEYFTQNFGFSDRTVGRLLKDLESAGYVRIENDQSKHRKIYAGLNPLSGKCSVSTPTKMSEYKDSTPTKLSGYSDKIDGVHIDSSNNNIINTITKKNTNNRGKRDARVCEWKPERFNKLWDFYPHGSRGSKQAAIRAWERLHPDDVLIDRMAKGLMLDMDSDEWQREIGIPHLSTYLNNQRWEDALEQAAEPETDSGGWAPDPEKVKYV